MSPSTPAHPMNRLQHAKSPYLLQHAHNPVDWYEWGPEALRRAREEDRPIFLSIGYSACHWCHVMAHECFENEAIAALLNRHFVCIKVDREERPDLDEIYMQATLLVNRGQGGWPMSVWLTPGLKPFFAGTYFPPESRYGRPGFRELCEHIARLWETDRAALLEDADRLAEMVARSLRSGPADGAMSIEDLDRAVGEVAAAFDPATGGVLSGATNKFPPSMALELLMRAIVRHGKDDPCSRRWRSLVELTLDEMARGGIYDHLAGGICRYSTDPNWHVPHFEKMLYDQALVSRAYVDAYRLTKKPHYRRVAMEIFDYVLDDLQAPGGGFYSARDADSEGKEGRYYVWTREEILEVLGPEDGERFCRAYGVTAEGNWRDPHEPGAVKNVLHRVRDVESLAREAGLEPGELERCLEDARRRLLAVRRERVPPALDDKVLAEWNGLMIAALARGGSAFDEPRYVQAAARAADFVLEHMRVGGRLCRSWREGCGLDVAFLSDYAALIEGLLELHEATFDPRWLEAARELNEVLLKHYEDAEEGGFFFTADDHESLIARTRAVRDGATPCGNSIQLLNLLRLGSLTGDASLRRRAERLWRCFAAEVLRSPVMGERFLASAEFLLAGPVEIVVVGDPAEAGTRALLREIYSAYLPDRVLVLKHPAASESALGRPSWVKEARPVDGKPTVYVCRNNACLPPVTKPADLAELLSRR